MPKKTADNKWLVDIRPHGVDGPRIRKKFDTKAEAKRFKAFKINEATHSPWNPQKTDFRRVSELAELWFQHHGQHLVNGAIQKTMLLEFAKSIGDKQARLVTPDDVFKFRNQKLDSGMKATTLNNYLVRIKTMYNKLKKTGVIHYENPIKNVDKFKTQEEEKGFLTSSEINTLLARLKVDDFNIYMLSVICLSTGARWQEAYNLTESDVSQNLIQYKQTKSKKIRKVPISTELEQSIRSWLSTRKGGLSTTREAFTDYVKSYGLKKRYYQSTHILRHSFAAHFIMNGGHLMTLKEILGHAKIETTMWYAHLSPGHLEEVVKLNPLGVDEKWTP